MQTDSQQTEYALLCEKNRHVEEMRRMEIALEIENSKMENIGENMYAIELHKLENAKLEMEVKKLELEVKKLELEQKLLEFKKNSKNTDMYAD